MSEDKIVTGRAIKFQHEDQYKLNPNIDRDTAKFVQSLADSVYEALNGDVHIMMDNVDDALFERADKASNSEEQHLYFDAMREIRLQRSSIEKCFSDNLYHSFQLFLSDQPCIEKKADTQVFSADFELSLVEDVELEESLAVDSLVTKTRERCADSLYCLSERFKVIACRSNYTDEFNPFDPRVIITAFSNCLEKIEIDISIELIIYKLFDRFVMFQLGAHYEELNKALAKYNILPELKQRKHQARVSGTMTGAYRSSVSSPSSTHVTSMETMMSPQELAAVTQGLSAPSGMFGAFAPLVGGQAPAMNVPGSAVSSVASTQQIISALAGVPAIGVNAQSGVGYIDGSQIKSSLMANMEAESENVALDSADENVIDIVSLVFDFIYRDKTIPDAIKADLGRLQLPVIKHAMLDKSFFSRLNDPARRLLNEIGDACHGYADLNEVEAAQLSSEISTIVEDVNRNIDDDSSAFEQALRKFQHYLRSEEEVVKAKEDNIIQEVQDKEDRAIASLIATGAIEELIQNHELPADVDEFLKVHWKRFLQAIYVKKGVHSSLWQKAMKIAGMLVWSLTIPVNTEELEKLIDILPSLLRSLKDVMGRMKLPPEYQATILKVLADSHTELIKVRKKQVWEKKMKQDIDSQLSHSTNVGNDTYTVQEIKVDQQFLEQLEDGYNNEEKAVELPEEDADDNYISQEEVEAHIEKINDSIAKRNFEIPIETPTVTLQSSPLVLNNIITPEEMRDYRDQVEKMEIGAWLENLQDSDEETSKVKLSWRSELTDRFVFVNLHGDLVFEASSTELIEKLSQNLIKFADDRPLLDRALQSLLTQVGATADEIQQQFEAETDPLSA